MKPGRFQLSPELKQRLAKPYAVENPLGGYHNQMELLTIQHELRQKNKEFRVLHERFQLITKRFKEMVFNHEKLMEQMETVHSRNEELQKENVSLTTNHQNLKWENERQKDKQVNLNEIEQEKNELKKYIAQLERILKGGEENPFQDPMELKRKIQELTEERINFEKECDQIQREQFIRIEELELLAKTLEGEKGELAKQFQEKNDKISQFSSSNLKLLHENKRLSEENRILREKVAPKDPQLVKEIERLRVDVKDLQIESEGKQQENDNLAEEITNLKRQLKDMAMEKDEYRKKVEEMSKQPQYPPSLPPPPAKIGNILQFSQVKNKFRIRFSNFEISKTNFPFAHSIPMLFSFGFYSFESVYTGVIWPDNMESFEFSQEFEVDISDLFICYLLNDQIEVSLNVTNTGETLKRIGSFQIELGEVVTRQNVSGRKKQIMSDRKTNIGAVVITYGLEIDLKSAVVNHQDINKLSNL